LFRALVLSSESDEKKAGGYCADQPNAEGLSLNTCEFLFRLLEKYADARRFRSGRPSDGISGSAHRVTDLQRNRRFPDLALLFFHPFMAFRG
jgi:hypothetical protein